jgi:hypothetical protein
MGIQGTSPIQHRGVHTCELHGANTGMRGGGRNEGPPNEEQGDGVGDGSLQSHSGVNLHPKTAKDRVDVLKGGEADGVALTEFPDAVTERLLHSMRKRRVPEAYVLFVERLLDGRHTRLKFDDFLSEWVPIDNGIGQGDPLSMILYLFYNADLLDIASGKGQVAVAYVDDANLYSEGSTYEEAYDSLRVMQLKEGGVKEWSQAHQSRFEKSKLAVVGFHKGGSRTLRTRARPCESRGPTLTMRAQKYCPPQPTSSWACTLTISFAGRCRRRRW